MLEIIEDIIMNGVCWGDVCSGGLIGIFGNPIFLGLIGLFFIIALGLVLRLSIDIMVLSGIVMFLILGASVLPNWLFWLAIIGAGIFVGIIIKRLLGR